MREHLVRSYDRIVESGERLTDLRSERGGWFNRKLSRWKMRIGKFDAALQEQALQRAFTRRPFLDRAFEEFARHCPAAAPELRLDRDAFVAASLLACGTTQSRWHAERWFRNESMPPDVRAPFHLDQPCEGTAKVLNTLLTLNQLLGQTFCLAFDQLEDTYHSLRDQGRQADHWARIAIVVRHLSVLPRFCLLFMIQQSLLDDFQAHAPRHLLDRMTAGRGVEKLRRIGDETACEMVRHLMQGIVWDALSSAGPPEHEPLFPFTQDEVRQLRVQSGGEAREFLRRVRERYAKILEGRPSVPPPPIELTHAEPEDVLSHEGTPLRLYGRNLPPDVEVYFGDAKAEVVVCRPKEGHVEVTPPKGLLGEIPVKVQPVGEPDSAATIVVGFLSTRAGPPYAPHIDRERFRACRHERSLTQAQVAAKVELTLSQMNTFETGRWKVPPDEVILRLVKFYERPLRYFLKQSS